MADPGGAPPAPPPQQDPFSFSHTFLLKSVCIEGWRPPTGNPGSATGLVLYLISYFCFSFGVSLGLSLRLSLRFSLMFRLTFSLKLRLGFSLGFFKIDTDSNFYRFCNSFSCICFRCHWPLLQFNNFFLRAENFTNNFFIAKYIANFLNQLGTLTVIECSIVLLVHLNLVMEIPIS